jgi:hypothetical protein
MAPLLALGLRLCQLPAQPVAVLFDLLLQRNNDKNGVMYKLTAARLVLLMYKL